MELSLGFQHAWVKARLSAHWLGDAGPAFLLYRQLAGVWDGACLQRAPSLQRLHSVCRGPPVGVTQQCQEQARAASVPVSPIPPASVYPELTRLPQGCPSLQGDCEEALAVTLACWEEPVGPRSRHVRALLPAEGSHTGAFYITEKQM